MAKFNIFEGGRRISHLIMLGAGIVAIYNVGDFKPRYETTYTTLSPNSAFVPSAENRTCGVLDHAEYKTVAIDADTSIHVTLCFAATDYPNGKFITYKIDKEGMGYGALDYSQEVINYAKQRANQFVMPAADIKEVYSPIKAHYENIKETIKFLMIFVSGFWAFTAAIGWILRGFLSIPTGRDSRPA